MTVIHLPPRETTVGEVLPLLGSEAWQRALLARRPSERLWAGIWWGALVGTVLGFWGGWIVARLAP